ncbi:MAG: YqgE/AlgH family protein [Microthrixaceae bacterium]|nr:YqgE/AlgH family protein [Microthrixaceae bacterium]MCB1011438.1 YqgE/AlgH family protein [Microthrixaceae bacterium]MCO5320012.1 YqgE/AlgH family protein [Microthrixaceae bacterium]
MSEDDPGAPPTRTRNRLLVSVPALPDDNFDRTVVYMIDHEDSGAIGVVLNRPTGSEVPEELRIGPAWASPPVVFSGGPVSPEAVIMLGRRQLGARQRGASAVGGTVAVLSADAVADREVEGVDLLRAYAGYAGWGPSQLDGELSAGVWVVLDALPDDVFSAEPQNLWRRVLSRGGGRLAAIARHPDDPSVN